MTAREVRLLLPGPASTPTGGYGYDRRIAAGLPALGWRVIVHELPPRFPFPDEGAREAAARCLGAMPDDALVLADGLAFGALPELAARHARRLRLVALVHHPLHAETGLPAHEQARLFESEREALRAARAVIATGRHTAVAMRDSGLAAAMPDVVEPGTDAAPVRVRRDAADCRMLCVATITPRKRHALLVEALAGLRELPWTLALAGSCALDRDCAAALHARIAELGLADRTRFHGVPGDDELRELRRHCDLCVQPAAYEGYGMALAEAIAQGLPAVATRTGAAAELVGDAGVLLDPGAGVEAWRGALAGVLADPARREAFAERARARAASLPRWEDAVRALAAVLERVRGAGP